MHFEYDGDPKVALNNIKKILENEGFKIIVTGMGSMDIPVTNLGKPEDLLKIKKMDRLPYKVQKKIFLSLTDPFEQIGLIRIYN